MKYIHCFEATYDCENKNRNENHAMLIFIKWVIRKYCLYDDDSEIVLIKLIQVF